MDDKFYIKKIVRDDGAVFNFDASEIYLAKDNTLLLRPDPETTMVEYTEEDGGEMIRQRNATFEQPINGLIIPKTSTYWQLRSTLEAFFQINHTYKIIYITRQGDTFATTNAWVSAGLQVAPVANEQYSEWSVGLTAGNVYLFEYQENAQGIEVFANVVSLALSSPAAGGEVWDFMGENWDTIGGVWDAGDDGYQRIITNSLRKTYPVWQVQGPCMNPSIINQTTGEDAYYSGEIGAGEVLIIDFSAGTAHLNGELVTANLSGNVMLAAGTNLIAFNRDSGVVVSTLAWNNIVS